MSIFGGQKFTGAILNTQFIWVFFIWKDTKLNPTKIVWINHYHKMYSNSMRCQVYFSIVLQKFREMVVSFESSASFLITKISWNQRMLWTSAFFALGKFREINELLETLTSILFCYSAKISWNKNAGSLLNITHFSEIFRERQNFTFT